jgi:hypothetical protein
VVFAMGYFDDLLFVFRVGLLLGYLLSRERFLCQKEGFNSTLGSLCGFFDSFLFGLRDCLLLSFLLGNDFLFGFHEEEDFDFFFFF